MRFYKGGMKQFTAHAVGTNAGFYQRIFVEHLIKFSRRDAEIRKGAVWFYIFDFRFSIFDLHPRSCALNHRSGISLLLASK